VRGERCEEREKAEIRGMVYDDALALDLAHTLVSHHLPSTSHLIRL